MFLPILFFSSEKFSLRVLFSFCLIFCQFQPCAAYKSLAYKKLVKLVSPIKWSKPSKISSQLFKNFKILIVSRALLFLFRCSFFVSNVVHLNYRAEILLAEIF